jgi:hypothetical protein
MAPHCPWWFRAGAEQPMMENDNFKATFLDTHQQYRLAKYRL